MKHRLIIIAILTFLLGIGIVLAMHPPGNNDTGTFSFTVMTCNVGDVNRHAFPLAAITDQITAGGKPDILFLQEKPGGKSGAALEAALAYPYGQKVTRPLGKMAGLMVLSVYPIKATREYPLPSQG